MEDAKDAPISQPREDFGIRKMDLARIIEGSHGVNGCSTSAVTLVKTATSTVVVDSGGKCVRDRLVRFMRENEAKIEKVNVLVSTSTSDPFSGNDDLFVHCLQHVRGGDWSNVPIKANRRVAISNPYHWIDKYLKIISLPFPNDGSLALVAHFPEWEGVLSPSTEQFGGKIVGICGSSVPSKDDPDVTEALGKARNMERPKGEVKSLEELLAYCDYIIPAFGPMFKVRG